MRHVPHLTISAHAANPPTQGDQLAGKSGIFALEVQGQITHLSATGNLGKRVARVLKAVPPGTQNVDVHCWRTGSKLQTSLLLYDLARELFPGDYLKRLHLRMPWFVALLAQDEFPRVLTTNRLLPSLNPAIGPFPNKEAAQLYAERIQSAFSLRRCTEMLTPSPSHPGCIYGEIKQCLRPCQSAVTAAEYQAEAAVVASFLHDDGRKTVPALIASRDRAVEATDFESAARSHKQIEKLREAMAVRSSIATDISNFHGVAITLDPQGQEVQLYPLVEGLWQPMASLSFAEASDIGNLESVIRTRLTSSLKAGEDTSGNVNVVEHLALFARWYFSTWRQGEWLPATNPGAMPYRRIAKSANRLLLKHAEARAKEQPATSHVTVIQHVS